MTEDEDFEGILERSKEPDTTVRLEGNIPIDGSVFDHSAEQQAIQEHEREMGVSTPEYPVDAGAPVLHPHIMIDAVGGLFGKLTDGEEIKVSAEESARFLRCALNDTEMYFDVQPVSGQSVSVRVAMPTEAFTSYAGSLVNQWPDFTGDSVAWILAMQQAHVWFCVRAVDDVPTAWSDFFADGVPKTSELLKVLRGPNDYMDAVFNMSAPRWRLLLEAVRIAEMKTKTCLAAWQQRAFFGTGDTES
jgi:hypothetical protein